MQVQLIPKVNINREYTITIISIISQSVSTEPLYQQRQYRMRQKTILEKNDIFLRP